MPSKREFSASEICNFVLYSLTIRVLTSVDCVCVCVCGVFVWEVHFNKCEMFHLRTISLGCWSPSNEPLFIEAISSFNDSICFSNRCFSSESISSDSVCGSKQQCIQIRVWECGCVNVLTYMYRNVY